MPFHRFEELEAVNLTPHLSSGRSPIVEGKYLYYCLNQKEAGTGSELHYHPNELLVFLLQGKVNVVIGKDRRIATPGMFILIPPNVRHSLKATEDGPCAYLYIKDQTWTVVGIGADEALPDKPMSVAEVNEKFEAGELQDRKGSGASVSDSAENEDIIIEGVPNCYYQILSSLDDPVSTGRRIEWIEGERQAFGFLEIPNGYSETSAASAHENFVYVLEGEVKATVGNDSKAAGSGDIIEIPKGMSYEIDVAEGTPARMVIIRSTDFLESRISA